MPADAAAGATLRLGLIGDNIANSRAPLLHRLAGRQLGLDIAYDLFRPRELGLPFPTVLDRCREMGLDGLNITHPYKETVMAAVTDAGDLVRRIGAANTIRFADGRVAAYNTDHTGFIAAYREAFADRAPGVVAQVGAGGAGRAVALALMALGVREIRLVDTDPAKARALAETLVAAKSVVAPVVTVAAADGAAAYEGVDAIVNCTPVGMAGHPGTPVPPACIANLRWAFDAVYTPPETAFRAHAEAAGARFVSGFELFLHQGFHAFEIFTGRKPADPKALRRRLIGEVSAAV